MDNNNHEANDGKKDGEEPRQCVECQREFSLGEDAIAIRHGVFGPRGFVPLEDAKYVCDSVCLRGHVCFDEREREKLPRRVP